MLVDILLLSGVSICSFLLGRVIERKRGLEKVLFYIHYNSIYELANRMELTGESEKDIKNLKKEVHSSLYKINNLKKINTYIQNHSEFKYLIFKEVRREYKDVF